MTTTVERPLAICPDCFLPPRNRWGARLPQRFPETLTPEHIDTTLRIHPWLKGTRLARLAEILRDVEVSNV